MRDLNTGPSCPSQLKRSSHPLRGTDEELVLTFLELNKDGAHLRIFLNGSLYRSKRADTFRNEQRITYRSLSTSLKLPHMFLLEIHQLSVELYNVNEGKRHMCSENSPLILGSQQTSGQFISVLGDGCLATNDSLHKSIQAFFRYVSHGSLAS